MKREFLATSTTKKTETYDDNQLIMNIYGTGKRSFVEKRQINHHVWNSSLHSWQSDVKLLLYRFYADILLILVFGKYFLMINHSARWKRGWEGKIGFSNVKHAEGLFNFFIDTDNISRLWVEFTCKHCWRFDHVDGYGKKQPKTSHLTRNLLGRSILHFHSYFIVLPFNWTPHWNQRET